MSDNLSWQLLVPGRLVMAIGRRAYELQPYWCVTPHGDCRAWK